MNAKLGMSEKGRTCTKLFEEVCISKRELWFVHELGLHHSVVFAQLPLVAVMPNRIPSNSTIRNWHWE